MIPGGLIQEDCREASHFAARTLLRTEIGVQYFIAVEATSYTWKGEFTLNISALDSPPNDECSNATDILSSNGSISGTTMAATTPTYFTSNILFFFDLPDVWYRIVGNGVMIAASLCPDATVNGTILQIYEGDKDNCANKRVDNSTNVESCQLEWFAELGVIYYIRVIGSMLADHFELRVKFIE
jgi:hypothetical protein